MSNCFSKTYLNPAFSRDTYITYMYYSDESKLRMLKVQPSTPIVYQPYKYEESVILCRTMRKRHCKRKLLLLPMQQLENTSCITKR